MPRSVPKAPSPNRRRLPASASASGLESEGRTGLTRKRFPDERSAAIAQRRLQRAIDDSPRLADRARRFPPTQGAAAGEAGAAVQRRLMPYEQVKTGKTAAVAGNRGKAGMKDIKGIYAKYGAWISVKAWSKAGGQLDALVAKLGRMRAKAYWVGAAERDAFIDGVLATIDQERTWLLGQAGRTKPDTPQPLGTGVAGPVPLANRRVVTLTMNQAVVGELNQLSFQSDNFSTCSPVAMYNAGTGRGGLFHFPALGLTGSIVKETQRRLRQMYDDVGPTVVWLNDRAAGAQDYMLGMPSDNVPIQQYLQGTLGYGGVVNVIAQLGGTYSLYLDAAGVPQAVMGDVPVATGGKKSVTKDRTKDERGALARAWEGMPSAMKYGIDEFSHLAY